MKIPVRTFKRLHNLWVMFSYGFMRSYTCENLLEVIGESKRSGFNNIEPPLRISTIVSFACENLLEVIGGAKRSGFNNIDPSY